MGATVSALPLAVEDRTGYQRTSFALGCTRQSAHERYASHVSR
ncbi:hypothetical protein OG311_00500 [Streptomyces sp. NBC_01343]|nr:hypothetical protein OG311_00500 [Streptomyces sp. NBC_01343]